MYNIDKIMYINQIRGIEQGKPTDYFMAMTV